jgi:hypothetical protein
MGESPRGEVEKCSVLKLTDIRVCLFFLMGYRGSVQGRRQYIECRGIFAEVTWIFIGDRVHAKTRVFTDMWVLGFELVTTRMLKRVRSLIADCCWGLDSTTMCMLKHMCSGIRCRSV